MPLQTPETILRSIADGDQLAFRQLYGMFSERVYNTALSYVQNREDAEEVTQDVFTNVYRSARKFRADATVSTWIYRIAINASLNCLKRKQRVSFLRLGDTQREKPDFVHPGVLLENKEKAQELFRAINTLPDSQKTAFILSFVEDLPRQEVADVMKVSLKAVESLLQRAKRNLRTELADVYVKRAG